MKIKLLASAVALSGLAACGGGDINLDASSIDNSVDNSVVEGGGDTIGTANPCAFYVENDVMIQGQVDGVNCLYTSAFVSSANVIESDVTFAALADNGAHIFNESLYVGENFDNIFEARDAGIARGGDGPTVFINAGAILAFQPGNAFVVNRGSQIRAEGTAQAPITITGLGDLPLGSAAPEAVGLWGGLVINGFGFTSACLYQPGWNFEENLIAQQEGRTELQLLSDTTDCSIAVEGLVGNDQTNFGGDLPEDNSGVLRYVVLKHAGSVVSADNELNGITFGAVGSGTEIENLEIYSNIDDGIEFFGGGADVEDYVAVYVRDDSIDLDDGYYGTINNALVIQGGGTGNPTRTGAHCVESDGASARAEATVFDENYLGRATINNLTCISSAKNFDTAGNDDPGAGFNFEEGHLVSLNNSIITTAYAPDGAPNVAGEVNNYCFQAEDTLDAVQIAAGLLEDNFSNNIFACADLAANGSEEILDLSSVDTASAQFITASDRAGDNTQFSGTGVMFLTDLGNLVTANQPDDGSLRPDEGVTLNILDGFVSVDVANMLIDGAALPAGFEQAGSTFTPANVGWTFGLIEGARSQPLWFEDGETIGAP